MFKLCKEHNYRKDLHYHVIAGEGKWMPNNIGHPESLRYNAIYPDKDSAHKAFLALANDFSAYETDSEDFMESRKVWYDIVDDVKRDHALEVKTFLGMEYFDGIFPLALIACSGCVPYGLN